MRIDVAFRNVDPSDALKAYTEEKVGRVKRFLIKPIDAHVILTRDGFHHIAEANVRTAGEMFTGKETSDADMYAAIDVMVDKLAKQARRHHAKHTDHRAPATGRELGRSEDAFSKEASADLDAELDALGE
ncbi:MAG: ribosome-associated translation inhibitor RaiA [Proteobacteria bacterium]|nr:ribosome-associated translation inhibitor RaiA [Pseudomonadota bacterium]